MRVLITGGAGFIGSHLAERYLDRGEEVFIIDDLSTGSLGNLLHLQGNPQISKRLFITVDTVLNTDVLSELIGTCDMVVHLAAAVGVQYVIDNPLSSMPPTLTTSPIASGESISRMMASQESRTCVKVLVCRPVPYTVMGGQPEPVPRIEE